MCSPAFSLKGLVFLAWRPGAPSLPTPRLPTRGRVVLVDVPGRRPFHLFYSLEGVHVPGA